MLPIKILQTLHIKGNQHTQILHSKKEAAPERQPLNSMCSFISRFHCKAIRKASQSGVSVTVADCIHFAAVFAHRALTVGVRFIIRHIFRAEK